MMALMPWKIQCKNLKKKKKLMLKYILIIVKKKSINHKIDDYDKKRKLYIEEVSKYEAYLVNKELGLLDPKNEN